MVFVSCWADRLVSYLRRPLTLTVAYVDSATYLAEHRLVPNTSLAELMDICMIEEGKVVPRVPQFSATLDLELAFVFIFPAVYIISKLPTTVRGNSQKGSKLKELRRFRFGMNLLLCIPHELSHSCIYPISAQLDPATNPSISLVLAPFY